MTAIYWFEDLREGFTKKSAARTVTEADLTGFAGLTGDYSPVHTDEEHCRGTEFGTRIAHGLLGLSIAQGLMWRTNYTLGSGVASLGWRNWSFKAPIMIGDTVHVVWSVSSARESSSQPDKGIIVEDIELRNQRNEVVQSGEHVLMVRKDPQAAVTSEG